MKEKQSDSKSASRVTRIKAGESKPRPTIVSQAPAVVATAGVKQSTNNNPKPTKNPLVRFARYVKGAFRELRQVIWPSRKETWSMTLAIILYATLISIIALAFDNLFNWLFKLIIK